NAIEQNEILLIHLPLDHLAYEDAAKALGTLLIMQIYGATFGFDNSNNQKSFTLVVDEFTKWVASSADDFTNLLQFGRQYGIRQILGHQNSTQLNKLDLLELGLAEAVKDALMSAKTVISLRTSPKDR